jgi:hypothetical protein
LDLKEREEGRMRYRHEAHMKGDEKCIKNFNWKSRGNYIIWEMQA